jgi:hypothetical protein
VTDLWVEASRDVEAEVFATRMAYAKVASASLWPFLASAQSDGEFNHRLALSYETLAARVEPELVDSLVASLREDYQSLRPSTAASTGVGPLTPGSTPHSPQFTVTSSSNVTLTDPVMQMWHVGSQKWVQIVAAAQESPQNPNYIPALEAGPETGETGTFPQEVNGPDPWNPINGNLPLPPSNVIPPANRFPAQPQQWSVPPNAGWVENPMQFGPYRSAQLSTHADANTNPVQQMQSGPLSYTDEGVETGTGQNPYYFGQGDEGLQSQDGGFPPDPSLAEPNERVDMYQNAQPNAQYMGYEQGYMAALHQANQYIHPAEGGGFNVVQKGTGKVLSHHDSQEDAEASFRAMEWHKHQGVQQAPVQFFDATLHRTADQGMDSGNQMAGNPYMTSGNQLAPANPVQAPPAMQQGGPGAEAMPPMGAGGPTPGQNSPGGMGPSDPGGSDVAAKTGVAITHLSAGPPPRGGWLPRVTARQYLRQVEADEYRGRPTREDPTGAGDDYTARTWENQLNQSPRQDTEDRGANTPQRPQEPIPTISSSDRQPAQNDDEMDERDREREASLNVYSGIGQNGPPYLTRDSWQTSPQGGAAQNSLLKIINASVSRALVQTRGAR